MKFIYALNEDARDELINNGYKYLNKCLVGNKYVYIFLNEGKKYSNNKNFMLSDKLTF